MEIQWRSLAQLKICLAQERNQGQGRSMGPGWIDWTKDQRLKTGICFVRRYGTCIFGPAHVILVLIAYAKNAPLTRICQRCSTLLLVPKPHAGPCSAIGSEPNCYSRCRGFDPSPVPYFCGEWSWNIFYCHSPPAADSRKAVVGNAALTHLRIGLRTHSVSWMA